MAIVLSHEAVAAAQSASDPAPERAPEGEPMKALVLNEPVRPPRSASDPDPEVPAKARRRRFTAKYKLGILEEADQCSEPGEIGALLRREGLYSSLLSKWRAERKAGALEALTPKKRGRKPRPRDPQAHRVAELERENARLRDKLEKAETIIAVQKKLSRLLASPQDESF